MGAKVYEPFPEGTVPEGWPREYVSKADYIAALADIDELQKANREWALSDAKTRSGWFLQKLRGLYDIGGRICASAQATCASANSLLVHRQLIGELRAELPPSDTF